MEKIIRELVNAIPQYLINFIGTISSPKNFPLSKLAEYEEETKKKITNSLKFVFLSFLIIFLINAARLNLSKTVFPDIFLESALQLVSITLLSFAIYLGWRISGSKANYFNYLIIYSFHGGVFFILYFLTALVSDGLLNYLEPELFEELAKLSKGELSFEESSIAPVDLWNNKNYIVSMSVLGGGYFLVMIWGFFGYGAYRKMNGATFGKMLLSMFIAGLFSWIVFGLMFLIRKTM